MWGWSMPGRRSIDNLPTGLVWTSNRTVVFRWGLSSNGSTPRYGGWNLDNIRCFTTDSWLPNMENGVVLLDDTDMNEERKRLLDSERVYVSPISHEYYNYEAIYTPETQTGREDL